MACFNPSVKKRRPLYEIRFAVENLHADDAVETHKIGISSCVLYYVIRFARYSGGSCQGRSDRLRSCKWVGSINKSGAGKQVLE